MSYSQTFFQRTPPPTLVDVDAHIGVLQKTITELRAKPPQPTADLQFRNNTHIATAEDELNIFRNRRESFVAAYGGDVTDDDA
jgi:hypothetical protein